MTAGGAEIAASIDARMTLTNPGLELERIQVFNISSDFKKSSTDNWGSFN
jgi:hypothetical protein